MEVLPRQVQQQLDALAVYDPPAPEAETNPATPAPESPPAAEAPAPEPAEVAPAAPAPPAENWEHKYHTLQGMMTSETNRARNEIAQLKEQLTAAIAKIGELGSIPQPQKTSITPKDTEAFGTDLIDLIERAAGDKVAGSEAKWAAEKARLEAEIGTLKATTQTAAERQVINDRNAYFAALAQQVPDYSTINTSEPFLAWCRETDPLSGAPRQKFLDAAFDAHDVGRTAAFFNMWKAAGTSTAATPPPPAPNKDLARQVAPNGSKATPTTLDTSPNKIWTTAEVDQFYTDVRKGLYRGRDADHAAFEAQIDKAMAEGRIR